MYLLLVGGIRTNLELKVVFSSKMVTTLYIGHDSGKVAQEKVENVTVSASVDVHEGVKTIAKMVKWLLTSFHVKVKKLIVVFDSSLVENEHKIGF